MQPGRLRRAEHGCRFSASRAEAHAAPLEQQARRRGGAAANGRGDAPTRAATGLVRRRGPAATRNRAADLAHDREIAALAGDGGGLALRPRRPMPAPAAARGQVAGPPARCPAPDAPGQRSPVTDRQCSRVRGRAARGRGPNPGGGGGCRIPKAGCGSRQPNT